MPYLLTIDAGTTSVKVGIFGVDGQLRGMSTQEYVLSTPSFNRVELPVNVYWLASKNGIREALKKTGIKADSIAALCICSQGETLILVDKKGKPLRDAIVWLDTRAKAESLEISQAFSLDEFYHITGLPNISPMWPVAKILWMRRNQSHIFKRTSKFLLLKDYLVYRLTGEFIADATISSSTGFLRLREKNWWNKMLDFIEIDKEQLPPIVNSSEVIGKIIPQVASELGLSHNTLVVAGAMDQMAGAVGAGNIAPDIVTETTGTALALITTVDKPIYDGQRRIPCSPHAVLNKFTLMPYSETAGIVLKWFRDTFGRKDEGKKETYDALMKLAKTVPLGSEGLLALPHFAGSFCPHYNPEARGAFVGISFNHKRSHFVRALVESIAFMLKENVELLKTLGVKVEKVRSLGGAAKSDFWLQVKSDVLNLPIELPKCSEASSLGAAILAGVGAGIYRDIDEAVKAIVSIKKIFSPRPEDVSIYQGIYGEYLDLCHKLYRKRKRECPDTAPSRRDEATL